MSARVRARSSPERRRPENARLRAAATLSGCGGGVPAACETPGALSAGGPASCGSGECASLHEGPCLQGSILEGVVYPSLHVKVADSRQVALDRDRSTPRNFSEVGNGLCQGLLRCGDRCALMELAEILVVSLSDLVDFLGGVRYGLSCVRLWGRNEVSPGLRGMAISGVGLGLTAGASSRKASEHQANNGRNSEKFSIAHREQARKD